MTGIEKYRYWMVLSDYDLATATDLIHCERWPYVAFLCQQAVERLLKGMYVCYVGKEAPKTHNVPFLFSKLADNEALQNSSRGSLFAAEKDEKEDFLIDLMFYYVTDYPFSYKKVMDRFIDRATALDIYEKTQELLSWLKSFQPEA